MNRYLFFIVEDLKEILLFQFDLENHILANRGDHILKLAKSDIKSESSIADFWAYSK